MSLFKSFVAPLTIASVALLVAAAPGRAADEKKEADSGVIRIKAGSTEDFKDHEGHVWAGDKGEETGFKGGETIARADDLKVENTEDPGLYRSERYSMESFSKDLPNGKYTVKLHFAETYEDVTAEGQRVFTFKVGDKEFKDFDVYKKAGGSLKAYVESVDVEVKDGKLLITFTPQVQNPLINAIEIEPAKKI